jgi:hypothetical protein
MQVDVVLEFLPIDAGTVYAYARQMENLPRWASGLATGIERRGDRWFSRSPMGEVEIVMAEDNPFGILDHEVTLPDGTVVYNAFRVSPAGDGSCLTFVVTAAPGTGEAAFRADVEHVRKDLRALRDLLVSTGAGGAGGV